MSLVAFQRVINLFKGTKYFVLSEDSTSLHIHSLLSLPIRCADSCDSPLSQQVDSPLSQQVTLKDNCYAPAHMILPMEQINKSILNSPIL